jgi:sulfhydrogenase subunit beta (sulfur reductase)
MNPTRPPRVLEAARLDALIGALREQGWNVVGPRLEDGAIVYDEIASAADLPAGWTDEHGPGRYRLARRADAALFGYVVGPHSWKKYLFPPATRLWTSVRDGARVEAQPEPLPERPTALLGVRACELAAIAIQDKVFLGGAYVDADYRARRENVLIVAVQCAEARGTCFCVSMGTGPRAEKGFDLALTELLEGEHRFVVEAGSERGARLLAQVPTREALAADLDAARAASARAAAEMGRSLDTNGLKELLQRNYEHPRWDDVAARCLSCANCTMVCPTCFCSSAEEVPDLDRQRSERWRRWDSCFTAEHSHLHGGSVRASTRSRYRQWIVHKLSTWHDQFDTSGCVGCGRCITWCPVGIDITEEAHAIRASEDAS